MVRAVLAGDRSAFAALVERHQNAVFGLLCSRVADRSVVEDLAQEALLKAYTDLGALREGSRFRAWLIGITRNVVADWGRRDQSQIRLAEQVERESVVEARPSTPEDDLERREVAEAVWAAIEQLPDSSREAVLLHYIGGLTDREIADTAGISASAVRSRLHYARQRLRDLMLPVAEEVLVRQRRTRRFTGAIMAALPLAIPRKAAASILFGLTAKELFVTATGIITIVGLLGILWSRQESDAQEIVQTTPRVLRLATAEQRAAVQSALAEEGDTPEQGGRHVKLDMRAEKLFPGSLNGCLRPALRAVGIDWSPDFLRGYLGRAFAFSMRPDGGHLEHTDIFDWSYFWEMLEALDLQMIDAERKGERAVSEEEYAQVQRRAWDAVRKSIDEGRPAISWQMYDAWPPGRERSRAYT
ncbi:MAG TPA: RNA polymerase sigma factor [Candidatus Latescibacteria bacterium]|nr:RNA polymerase sigma factor [Candidatus Latescibacterota bacterium]MDP7339581.1 RNA polymerase sigma factor [Vicinamibacterales bacterium]HJP29513.1 RNA polymerase sigma factor [Candidatus Latescibacterota bacterium]